MLKRDQMGDPTSQWNKALQKERVFCLLGRDKAAPEAIRHWVSLRTSNEMNKPDDPQIVEAMDCAARMEFECGAIQNELAEKAIVGVTTRELLRKIVEAAWSAAKGEGTPTPGALDQIINTAITAEEKS